MMPINDGLTLPLPTGSASDKHQQPLTEVVTIAGIKDEVELLPSICRPKKVSRVVWTHCVKTFACVSAPAYWQCIQQAPADHDRGSHD